MTQDKETLREAVARAICEAEGYSYLSSEHYDRLADAAIATLFEAQATRIEALEAALRETMSRCTDCGGRGSFVKHDEVTERDLWESCASCAVGYAALESQP